MTNKTTLLDLNMDCMMMIFDQLPKVDLFSLGAAHENLAFAVRSFIKVIRKRVIYCKKEIGYYHSPDVKIGADYIEISGLPTMLNILKCCRHLLTKFTILENFDIPKSYYKMPMLDELTYSHKDDRMIKSAIGLFENNPQIRNLTLRFASSDLLPALAKITNLESLELTGFVDRDEHTERINYHFDNLKVFKMNGETKDLPQFTFDHLEEFDIDEWGSANYSPIMSFVLANKESLKRLRLNVGLWEEEILELTKANLNVTEMSFATRAFSIKANVVCNLITSAKHVKKLVIYKYMVRYWNLEFRNSWDRVFNELATELEEQWYIRSSSTFTSIIWREDHEDEK